MIAAGLYVMGRSNRISGPLCCICGAFSYAAASRPASSSRPEAINASTCSDSLDINEPRDGMDKSPAKLIQRVGRPTPLGALSVQMRHIPIAS
jgi:hypothetical protein